MQRCECAPVFSKPSSHHGYGSPADWHYIYTHIFNSLRLVTHVSFGEWAHHWFRWWLVTKLVPSHMQPMPNYCQLDAQGQISVRFQNTNLFSQINAFENFVCKLMTILSLLHSFHTTVWSWYNTDDLLWDIHDRHPIACSWGQDHIGCPVRVQWSDFVDMSTDFYFC